MLFLLLTMKTFHVSSLECMIYFMIHVLTVLCQYWCLFWMLLNLWREIGNISTFVTFESSFTKKLCIGNLSNFNIIKVSSLILCNINLDLFIFLTLMNFLMINLVVKKKLLWFSITVLSVIICNSLLSDFWKNLKFILFLEEG